ncbi:MAG: CDP-diacylglycerol--glycerol-3-phosphate 3-phosphatidyltransferase [Phycisphaerae bacterium]|nr:CDP-diacylglycerol--glycerol-3-phosphate 3-phosphatidyltransferase [Phycisphaerae bacterium]
MSLIKKHLPNVLTGSRIFFAAGFVFLLYKSNFKSEAPFGPATKTDTVMMLWSFILFIVAAITDIIDGPLARRWNTTSAFGRWFDPFVDKILVGGGFILLALRPDEQTGVQWWMVIVILAREVYITIARSILEANGKAFGAVWTGKTKMILQSIAIGTTVFCMTFFYKYPFWDYFRNFWIWAAVVFTAFTAVDYTIKLRQVIKNSREINE